MVEGRSVNSRTIYLTDACGLWNCIKHTTYAGRLPRAISRILRILETEVYSFLASLPGWTRPGLRESEFTPKISPEMIAVRQPRDGLDFIVSLTFRLL